MEMLAEEIETPSTRWEELPGEYLRSLLPGKSVV
jgi:hypothetical protein